MLSRKDIIGKKPKLFKYVTHKKGLHQVRGEFLMQTYQLLNSQTNIERIGKNNDKHAY